MSRPVVEVDALSLGEILRALHGPGHLIREIQATAGAHFPDNPLNILTNSYNVAVDALNADAKEQE